MPSQVDQEKYEAVRTKIKSVCLDIDAQDIANAEVWDEINRIGDRVFGRMKPNHWAIAHKIFNVEIQLSHVLRAVRAKQPNLSVLREDGIEIKYKSSRNHPLYWEPNVLKLWNLTEDDLSQQSPEVIYFLWEVLCKI